MSDRVNRPDDGLVIGGQPINGQAQQVPIQMNGFRTGVATAVIYLSIVTPQGVRILASGEFTVMAPDGIEPIAQSMHQALVAVYQQPYEPPQAQAQAPRSIVPAPGAALDHLPPIRKPFS